MALVNCIGHKGALCSYACPKEAIEVWSSSPTDGHDDIRMCKYKKLMLAVGNMSVTALQRLYLRLKRDVFSCSGILQKGNSQQLEWYLTRELKGTMNDVSHPKLVIFHAIANHSCEDCRVLVSAVRQSSSGIKLIFFNNCFEDDYSKGVVTYSCTVIS